MDVEQLNINEELLWGTGVIFDEWPTQDVMLSTMANIRNLLHTTALGDIVWHLAQTESGWNLSGNLATISVGTPRTESPKIQENKAASDSPLQTSEENFLRNESVGSY